MGNREVKDITERLMGAGQDTRVGEWKVPGQ